MPKAGDFLMDEGGVYLAFNSNNEVKKRKLKITVDPVAIYGLERLANESELTGEETVISRNTATAQALRLISPSTGTVIYVSNVDDMLDALANAESGDIVVVQNDIESDSVIDVPAGVSLVGYGYQLGSPHQIEMKLKNTSEGVNIKLREGSVLAGFSFVPLEPLSCVVGTFDAFADAEVHYCTFNGTFYDYTTYLGSITVGISNNVSNHLVCENCTFVDCYIPIQHNGVAFTGNNLTWNSGAVFSAPALPTFELINGIAGAKPASNCDFISNETVTVEAIEAFCNTLSKTATNMGFRINGTPYTPREVSVTVPMALPDGSVLFYDRGTSYGEYKINDSGYPERIDGAVDDGSAESLNWRYLICGEQELDNGRKEWGRQNTSEGIEETSVGYGLPNTEAMLPKYGGNSSYIWQLVQNKRNVTDGKKWFVPSRDELDIVYENKDIIVDAGGDSFPTDKYWSSSEVDDNIVRVISFLNGNDIGQKDDTNSCRLIRRV